MSLDADCRSIHVTDPLQKLQGVIDGSLVMIDSRIALECMEINAFGRCFHIGSLSLAVVTSELVN